MDSSSDLQFSTFVGEGVENGCTIVALAPTPTSASPAREVFGSITTDALKQNGHNGERPADAMLQRRTLTNYMIGCEREAIFQALDRNQWSRTKTAKELGISRVTLYNKMKKFGISDKTEATQAMVGLAEVLPAGQQEAQRTEEEPGCARQ